MSLKKQIAELARLAVGVEASNLPTIIRLQEGLQGLVSGDGLPAGTPSVGLIDQATASLDSIVMRELDNADAALREVIRVLDYLQLMAETLEEGGDVAEIPAPVIAGAASCGGGTVCEPCEPVNGAASGARVVVTAEVDDTLHEFIGEAGEHLELAESALLELESAPTDGDLINTVFRSFHTIKGVAGFLNLAPIVKLSHSAEFLLDGARSGSVRVSPGFIELVLRATDTLGELVRSLGEGVPPLQSTYDGLLTELEAARAGDIAPQTLGKPEANDTRAAPENGVKQARGKSSDTTVKVNTQRLDELVDMVGELVISHQMVVQDPAIASVKEQRTNKTLGQVAKIIRDLQELAMSLRMVTLHGPFQKMTRVVRDLSKKSGKEIEIRVEGEDTELDRNVVAEIGDPLVHMVRNACDHGIETPEERRSAGKPERGTLTLRAYHRGGSIVVEVEDDGRGLDRDKLIAKALERGVIGADTNTAELTDSEVYGLIMAPGFSTAEAVTDISGRGVGMDVVRRNIEALRGSIEIRSVKGKGSTFILSLPLTMAIIDGMVVRIGGERFVVPTLSIERSFRPEAGQVSTVMGGSRMVSVRGSLLPLFQFGGLFGVAEPERDLDDALVVVLESSNSRMCLVVDEILGQQQVVIKSLGQRIGRITSVSGAAILGDGRVALILDVGSLFMQVDEYTQTVPQASSVAGEPS